MVGAARLLPPIDYVEDLVGLPEHPSMISADEERLGFIDFVPDEVRWFAAASPLPLIVGFDPALTPDVYACRGAHVVAP